MFTIVQKYEACRTATMAKLQYAGLCLLIKITTEREICMNDTVVVPVLEDKISLSSFYGKSRLSMKRLILIYSLWYNIYITTTYLI